MFYIRIVRYFHNVRVLTAQYVVMLLFGKLAVGAMHRGSRSSRILAFLLRGMLSFWQIKKLTD